MTAKHTDPIEVLELSTMTRNSLHRSGIYTVSDLITKNEDDLLEIRQFGEGCLDGVLGALADHGLDLRDPRPALPPIRQRPAA